MSRQTTTTRPQRSTSLGLCRLARVLRVLAIVGVLCAELFLLMRIYHLDDPVEDRRVVVSVAAARVDDALLARASGTDLAAYDGPLGAALAAVAAVEAPGAASLADLDPADAASLPLIAERLDDIEQQIDAQGRSADLEVLAWLLGLFTVVCVGWFTWFGRLARRHREAQEKLTARQVTEHSERRLQALGRSSSDVVAVLQGDSTTSFVTHSTQRVLGRSDESLIGGRFIDLLVEEDRPLLAQLLARPDGAEHELSVRLPHHDGRELIVEGTLKDLHEDPTIEGWVLTLRDVTERHRLEQNLQHQAFHDALTDLPNRQLFLDRLEQALWRREAGNGALSVLFVDLDDFKIVNDSLGHDVGDQLLVAAAARMAAALRPQDTVARLGGDEFAVLLDGTDLDGAGAAAQRLLDTLAEPMIVDQQRHTVRASIGVAGVAHGGETAHDLMRNADVAMYHAKSQGKGGIAPYDESLHTRALELLELRAELADAITGDQLVVYYQPTVALQGQAVVGFEALVRWQHPTRGLVMPNDFIPVAEDSGLVVPLGAWVLRRACLDAAELVCEGRRLTMSVNVAAQQLNHPDFYDMVVESLAVSGLAADRLVLEVTETVLLADVDVSAAALTRLRTLGVRVAIDDFGTGYNSLTNLAVLPIDVLKVDRSFVMRLGGPDDTASLVEAILAMSAALNLDTVAEGVELAHQADWLRSHSALLGQGYLWSRPVDLAQARILARDGVVASLPSAPRGASRTTAETTLEVLAAS